LGCQKFRIKGLAERRRSQGFKGSRQ